MLRLLLLLPVLLLLSPACHDSNLYVPVFDCEADPCVNAECRPQCEHPRSKACYQRQMEWASSCMVPDDPNEDDEGDDEYAD